MASIPAAPLPPEIEQQQSPEAAQSVFAQQNIPREQPPMQGVQAISGKLQELEKWVQETRVLVRQFDPNFQSFLVPIANAGAQLRDALQTMVKQSGMATGSPQVQPQPPMNPAAGPPNPNAV
jgi:hypothetical protein